MTEPLSFLTAVANDNDSFTRLLINWQSFSSIKGQVFATDSPTLPTGDVLVVQQMVACASFAPAVVLVGQLNIISSIVA